MTHCKQHLGKSPIVTIAAVYAAESMFSWGEPDGFDYEESCISLRAFLSTLSIMDFVNFPVLVFCSEG